MLSMAELRNRLRKTFRDEHKIQWSDTLLDEILFEAQREYAIFSGGLIGKFAVITNNSPVFSLPADFFEVVQVIGPDGANIPVVSYRRLAEKYGDFRKDKGNAAESFCFNFDSFGKCRVYPDLPEGTFAGTVIYKRLPAEKEWICPNPDAVEKYALFQMYQFTGKSLSVNYYKAFMEAIYQEQQQKQFSGSRNVYRTGVYY